MQYVPLFLLYALLALIAVFESPSVEVTIIASLYVVFMLLTLSYIVLHEVHAQGIEATVEKLKAVFDRLLK